MSEKIKTLEELKRIIKNCKKKGKKIVWTNGCFDLVHITHINLLKKAKVFGDILIVGVNSDNSVRRLKGLNRPINVEKNRLDVIASFESVDYVIAFNEDSPKKIIEIIKPDVYIKGGDYNLDTIVQDERKIVESYNGRIEILKTSVDFSTSKLISKIRESRKLEIDSHKLNYHPKRVSKWLSKKDCYPLYVEIGLTNACNHKCIFCALNFMKHKFDFIDKDIMLNALSSMSKNGVKSIMFAGEGEPLLHKDIEIFCKKAYEQNINASITTNGIFFNNAKINECLEYLTWIRFSVNAGTAKTYAKLHGTKESDFDRVINNIKKAVKFKKEKNLNCTIGVQFLMMKNNFHEVKKLIKLLQEIGVDNLQIKPYSHHPLSKHDYSISIEDYKVLTKNLDEFNNKDFKVLYRHDTVKRIERGRTYLECYGLPFITLIDCKGNIIPCNLYYTEEEFFYGNLYENSFSEIWDSEKRKKVLEKLKKKGVNECRKGCRLDAINSYLYRLKNPQVHDNFI